MPKPQEATPSAADFLPVRHTIPALRRASETCRGCDLYRNATQTVFGEGRASAHWMLVGEQPGDVEDREGRPFVGPAGRLLDELLLEAEIDRRDVYVTNAVKHFKWTPRGKRRLHGKPNARELAACRPWLEAEIDAVEPSLILCLGASASQQLLGSAFRLTRQRGEVIESASERFVMATYHPSAVLRALEPDRRRMRRDLLSDLRAGKAFVASHASSRR